MKIQAPPTLPKDKQPFAKMVMPVIMLIAVGGMVAAMVMSGAARSPMTFIFPLMMLGSMSMMFSPSGNIDELRRSYHRHVDALRDSLHRDRERQLERMTAEHPAPDTLWTLLPSIQGGHNPAAAALTDVPAGVVRVGTATQAPEEELEIPVEVPPEDLEPVSAMSLRAVALEHSTLTAPVAIDLGEFQCIAIVGDGAAALARAMQAQLAMHTADGTTITGPYDEWLPHDGPLHVRFCQGDVPLAVGAAGAQVTVIAEPNQEWIDTAKSQGLLLRAAGAEGDFVLSAWTIDGWAPFGIADQLDEVQLAMLCRAQSSVQGTTSILELPGGDLRAPIGFGASPVYLDIKESALGGIGPHGLCIGATGSGKSELLKSIVISFAHQHPAEELNFVLVDFKGGASFLGMERLPHTSAVITNLSEEASLVDRMKDSLLGEMHRRQERLRTAGFTTAAEFNRAFPGQMPALFIVVDEFSELLHARPEFADVFAAIGRLGRSLRMHLLLASQRLEEGRLRGLESHLSYRIALRTFSASESRALIGSTAAHELPASPGAAILASQDQTRFQAAYVSGPELPKDQRLVRELGSSVTSNTTTLELVIDRLAGPNLNPVWLPPLPRVLPAHQVMAEGVDETQPGVAHPGHMVARVGLEDRPFEGEQVPFDVDISRKHWVVVGQPRTGKTTVLRDIALGLALSTPGLAMYVFDPGGSLSSLARLPQVAAVVSDPVEGLSRLLDELDNTSGPRVLFIDGADQLGDLEPRVIQLAARALEKDLHLVISSLRWNLRPSLRDVLTGLIELKMNPTDSQFRDSQRALPDVPGRGIGESPSGSGLKARHVQFAFSTDEDIEHVRRETLARGENERSMRTLPQRITRSELSRLMVEPAATATPHEVFFALGGPCLEPVAWNYREFSHLVVVGQSGAGGTETLRSLLAGLRELPIAAEFLISDTRRGLLDQPGYSVPEDFAVRLRAATEVLRSRIPTAEVTPRQLKERSWWEGAEYFVVLDDADTGPGLDLLTDLLPYAADIGLHVVMARKSGGFQRNAFHPVMQGLRDQSAWLLHSAPREDGPIAGTVLAKRPAGRAIFLHGTSWEVQVAVAEDATDAEAPGVAPIEIVEEEQ